MIIYGCFNDFVFQPQAPMANIFIGKFICTMIYTITEVTYEFGNFLNPSRACMPNPWGRALSLH